MLSSQSGLLQRKIQLQGCLKDQSEICIWHLRGKWLCTGGEPFRRISGPVKSAHSALLTVLVKTKGERTLLMGEEKSKLLQAAHITVLGVYTLSPIPYIWSGGSGDSLHRCWAALCWGAMGHSAGTLDSESVMGPDASETWRVLGCFFGNPEMMQGQYSCFRNIFLPIKMIFFHSERSNNALNFSAKIPRKCSRL